MEKKVFIFDLDNTLIQYELGEYYKLIIKGALANLTNTNTPLYDKIYPPEETIPLQIYWPGWWVDSKSGLLIKCSGAMHVVHAIKGLRTLSGNEITEIYPNPLYSSNIEESEKKEHLDLGSRFVRYDSLYCVPEAILFSLVMHYHGDSYPNEESIVQLTKTLRLAVDKAFNPREEGRLSIGDQVLLDPNKYIQKINYKQILGPVLNNNNLLIVLTNSKLGYTTVILFYIY